MPNPLRGSTNRSMTESALEGHLHPKEALLGQGSQQRVDRHKLFQDADNPPKI